MKKILTLSLALLIGHLVSAQIIISEIMYNPPESPQDEIEYIELFNDSNDQIPLKDYRFSTGVIFTFPDVHIKPNSYLVIAKNDAVFDSVFGFLPLEWDTLPNNGLNNNGEIITLVDDQGNFIDSVRYDDRGVWPREADGDGYSIELCRIGADNGQGIFWKASQTATGVMRNGKEVFASPGAANAVACADHEIIASGLEFTPDYLEINVGETVEFQNTGGIHNVNGLVTIYPNNPESFYSGQPEPAPWSFIYKFNTSGLYDYRCDAHHSLGMTGQILVKMGSTRYPNYPVGIVSSTDADGVADSLDVDCTLIGTVYGPNFRPGGLTFTIIDEFGDGIGVFNSQEDLGYSVQEGDIVRITGFIDQFAGLIQIVPDSITVLSSGNPLLTALPVSELNENTESQFIKLENVSLVNPVQWTNSPLGFTVELTNGQKTYKMRVDDDVDFHGEDPPTGTFSVTGTGDQYDPTFPHLDGYAIKPRYKTDIDPYKTTIKEYPQYTIRTVTDENIDGVADSLGVLCELLGTVVGIDFNGGVGVDFTIHDGTGGINVATNRSVGYIVKEGDRVSVKGVIEQFRGLTRIRPDSVKHLASGRPLPQVQIFSTLNEDSESELIRLNDVTVVDPNDWKGDGSSFNVRVMHGTRELVVRIDNDCNLSRMPLASEKFTVTGIGSQFDSSSPYHDGYQMFPRYFADIVWKTATVDIDESGVRLYPNPVYDKLRLKSPYNVLATNVYTLDGTKLELPLEGGHVDVHSLPAGIYALEIFMEEGRVIKRFTKR